MLKKLIFVLAMAVALTGCQKKDAPKGSEAHIDDVTSAIDDDALTNAQDAPGDWTSYGLNYKEDRFSPLTQINKDNVSQLSLAWSTDLGTNRGIEATPLVVDGIMFLSGP
ncbi:MAG: hypothetical protein KA527_10340, partial [Cytophagaceae bacterium]|nr:hypothetical protein [Cytophagaceae bacterium]